MKKPKLLFTEDAAELVLEAFNYYFDKNGFIAHIETGERALTTKGETIHKTEFGGVMKGEHGHVRFLKSGLLSIMEFADEFLKEKQTL